MSWNRMRPGHKDDRAKVRAAYKKARKAKRLKPGAAPSVTQGSCRRANKGVGNGKAWQIVMKALPCFYCGAPGGTIDHVIPRSKGGKASQSNCVPSCKWCNGHKGDRSPEEFKAWLIENHYMDQRELE